MNSNTKEKIKNILTATQKNKTLSEYHNLIDRQICGCQFSFFNKTKDINDQIILFFKSINLFYNPKTDKFEKEISV